MNLFLRLGRVHGKNHFDYLKHLVWYLWVLSLSKLGHGKYTATPFKKDVWIPSNITLSGRADSQVLNQGYLSSLWILLFLEAKYHFLASAKAAYLLGA